MACKLRYLPDAVFFVWFIGFTFCSPSLGPGRALASDEQDASTQLPLPPISQVVDKALDYLPRSLSSYELWNSKIQQAAGVPELQLQYLTDENAFSRYQEDAGTHWEHGFRAALSWDLSRFIFDPEQLEAVKVQQRVREQEMQVRSFVIDQYYDIKFALLSVRQGAARDNEAKALRGASKIDSLTNNTFALTRRVDEYIQISKSTAPPPDSSSKNGLRLGRTRGFPLAPANEDYMED